MARKTKAELNEERKAAEARQLLAEAEAYPARVMAALEEATTKNNYELEVRNGKFMLRDRDSSDQMPGALTLEYTCSSQVYLENLEWDLKMKEEERAEAERLRELRRAAFAKLSKEEQNALGLTDRNNW